MSTRELTEAELEAVSGGGGLNAGGSNEVEVAVELQKKMPIKMSYEKITFEFGLSHSHG